MIVRRTRRPLLAALACVAVAASGCGNKEAVVTEAKTEGIYLDVGPLDYQVQLSRVINPAIVPDKDYFIGLPEAETELGSTDTWFAVFIRVQNQTDRAEQSAEDFEIVDTQEKVYRPVAFQAGANPIAYVAKTVQPKEQIPAEDSLAADGPTQGAMLLFRLPFPTLANRPLEFKIKSAQSEAVVDLDV